MDETRPENRLKVLHRKLVLMVTDMKSLVEQARLAKNNSDQVPLFQAMFPDGVTFREKFYQTYEEMEGIATLNEIEFPTEKEKSLLNTIKRYYYETVTIFNSFPKSLDYNQTALSTCTGFFGAKSKLPKIRIPTFDGNPLAWPHFRDTYHSLVHQELNLSDMEKYHYLHSSLTSEALALVQHIPFTEQGYNLAWETLKERYNNKRILASVYLKQLLDFKPISQPNIEGYRMFLNVVADNINAFKRLDLPDATEFILFTLAIRCLDYKSREVFETQHIKEDFPRFSDLIQFIKDKCQVLELSSAMTSSNTYIPSKASALHSKPFGKTFSKTVFLASGQNLSSLPNSKQRNHETDTRCSSYGLQNDSCFICKGQHILLKCPKFLNFSPKERFNSLKGFPGCRNHLSQRHTQPECRMPVTCHFCQGSHHSLLHFSDHESSVVAENNSDETKFVTQNRSSDSATIKLNSVLFSASTHFPLKDPISSRNVLLSTAEVDIKDSENKFQRIRILIDPGAQTSLITAECAKKLGLSPTDCKNKNITGVGGIKLSATGHIICTLKPRTCSNAKLTTSALIVPHIASQLPQATVPFNILSYCQNLHLADPHFGQPGPIEFLLGADLYAQILKSGASKVGRTSLFKIKTIFGFIITGSYFSEESPPFISLVSDSSPAIEQLVKRFWEIEEPEPQEYTNKEHDISEKHFLNTYVRLNSGRFSVSLPFKASIGNFGPSRHLAEKRFYNLEIKLNKNPSLKKDYTTFMEEYEGLGHMSLVSTPGKYYIPHHCVIKEDSSTTKLRVVFDGSSKAGSLSLNEALLIGPKLQLDICDILLNFRLHSVVFTADISKMYRQILVHEEDRAYQHILWRSSTQAELKEFELNTLTYGTSCAPYLALRVIKELIHLEKANYPLAASVLETDMYIDDIITGTDSITDALKLQNEIKSLLLSGGFELRKWSSNSRELLALVPEDHQEKPLLFSEQNDAIIKILGIQWSASTDNFSYMIRQPSMCLTKRTLLSNIARIYDPLGYLSPVIFYAKVILQSTWKMRLEWDENLPSNIANDWICFLTDIQKLSNIEIPRFIRINNKKEISIIGFCDASELGFAGMIYLKDYNQERVQPYLLKAKTRLAPLKSLTIPRLELCGALLLTSIYRSLKRFLNHFIVRQIIFFTDSTVVLGWIKTPLYNLKSFVANRISQILEQAPDATWMHVQTQENPADQASRGLLITEFLKANTWWNGPWWLSLPYENWPNPTFDSELMTLPELRVHSVIITDKDQTPYWLVWMSKYSSFQKLLHVLAYIYRFFNNLKYPESKTIGNLNTQELKNAEAICYKLHQQHYFKDEITPESEFTSIRLKRLSPFFDRLGVLRVGGRLGASDLPDSAKHPIILPNTAHLSTIIVDHYHQEFLHPGPQLLQSLLRQKFWILASRCLVKKRIFKCLRCYKLRAKPSQPIMGNLPLLRFDQTRAFVNVGIDFAGPFMIKESRRRNAALGKAYLCLFVCLSTKALHLEIVSELTTNAFLAAFDRFISRRGLPSHIITDCGTTFVGASRELKRMEELLQSNEHRSIVSRYLANKEIQWSFNPPYAPNFGGIWEAGVKSAKYHLQRVARDSPFTFEELSTLFTRIEGILNSRPLCPLSSEPDDLNFLTPAHFLIGDSITSRAEENVVDTHENRLTRWQLIQQRTQHFWSRWRMEYLNTLQQRTKWHQTTYTPSEGDLVLLWDKNQAPLDWPTARIVEIHPGNDLITRVVTVQLPNKKLAKRPLNKCIPLNCVQSTF